MAEPAVDTDISQRIDALKKCPSGVDPQEIIEIVESIMTTINGDMSSGNLKLYAEIDSLAQYINNAKVEIAALRPDEITDEHLPTASDELSAIVGATEQATNSIFEAVEAIEELASQMDEKVGSQITEAVTKVYEACGFQDITGQRITKVVSALQHIDNKVQALLDAFGDDSLGVDPEERKKIAEKRTRADGKPDRPDEDLMNGPQSEDEASSQDDIDALLASFD